MIVSDSHEYYRLGYIQRTVDGIERSHQVEVMYIGSFGYRGEDVEIFYFGVRDQRDKFFAADNRYCNSISKRTYRNGRVTKERFIGPISDTEPFDPQSLNEWDPDVLDLLRELPDHVLDVIGLTETPEQEKPNEGEK